MRTGPSNTLIAHKAISLSEELSGTEKRVAAVIVDHFNRKTGQCDPALDSIAKLLGVSRRTIIRAISTLVRKGYFQKTRHGGKFHRNSYLPIWSRFQAHETKWNEKRRATRRTLGSERVSPLQGQTCQHAGDADVTQTYFMNPLNETLLASQAIKRTEAVNKRIVRKGLFDEGSMAASHTVAKERFHVKSANSRDAARDAAERRWTTALTKLYATVPELFALIIDAIDDPLSEAATTLELHRCGSGLQFVLDALRGRLPAPQPPSSAISTEDVASFNQPPTRGPTT